MFAETLRDIATRLENIDAIFLMGIDGLPIEKIILNDSLDMEKLSVEFTTILRVTAHTINEVNAGTLEEVLILSDQMIVLTKAITTECFLLIIMPEGGNIGRARFELKKAKYILEKEFV